MNDVQGLTLARLRGEIRRVVFENEDTQFAVLKVVDDSGLEHAATGPMAGLAAGQYLEMEGYWERHLEFGRQFRAESYQIRLPNTADGIKRFLSGGAIPGIGKKTASLIVDYFGDQTLVVLDNFAKRLEEVPGIGKKKAEAVVKGWRESAGRRESFIFLQGLGITPAYCARLFKRYGDAAPQVVRKNPYRLAEEVDGIGFLKADEIARNLGIAPDSIDRLAAAAVFSVNTLVGNGHVCLPLAELVRQTSELAKQPPAQAEAGIEAAIERRLLRKLDDMIYTPQLARAETELPELVASLALVKKFAGQRMHPVPGDNGIVLNQEQQRAVDEVSLAPLSIITGGPGVGKTTVVGEIVRRAEAAGLRIGLAAPTGRAAKRLSDSTGLTAKTLHRLLQFDPNSNRFQMDSSSPLEVDLLIVDEVSMLDILLALALFRAVRPGTSVVLVGDADQLPSVGPGTVLAGFLESEWFQVTRLVQIFRQAENSHIITNAHRVNRGLLPEKPQPGSQALSDFYWIEQDDPDKALAVIEKMVAERIPARFHFDPVDDVQILTPMNRGSCGTVAINERLQALLNPGDKPEFRFGDRVYRAGDKLMQTANNYEKNVFNGDLGRLGRISLKDKTFTVIFEGSRLVEYNFDEADQLTRAYAITVHKSQGSEFPVVILPFLSQHYMMLQRNLLYTAMTRARKLLILVGSRRAVQMAVDNARLEPRFSLLTQRLAALRRKLREVFPGQVDGAS